LRETFAARLARSAQPVDFDVVFGDPGSGASLPAGFRVHAADSDAARLRLSAEQVPLGEVGDPFLVA
jgi:hypothetical protein